MSRCGENPVVWGDADSAPPAAAPRRKFLRNKSLESKVALDAVPRASYSIRLGFAPPLSCFRCGDCVRAGLFSLAEFA